MPNYNKSDIEEMFPELDTADFPEQASDQFLLNKLFSKPDKAISDEPGQTAPPDNKQNLLKRFQEAAQPVPTPAPELETDRYQKTLGNLALLRAGNQIGQAISGGQSGVFKADQSGPEALEGLAKEEHKVKGDQAATQLYRDMLKMKYPQLEISKDVPADHLKSLIANFQKASKSFQQSDYMTKTGEPVTFDPATNKYINPVTGQTIREDQLIRNYVKTITDPNTGQIIEVRPGVGAVGTLGGAPSTEPKVVSETDRKDYTFQMLDPKQREYVDKTRDAFLTDVKDARELGEAVNSVEDLIDSDISGAIPAIKRQLARSVGHEVGVMTDADVASFSGDQSLLGALARYAKLQATGKMTDEDKEQFRGIIAITRKNINKGIEKRSGYHIAGLQNRLPDATPASLRSLISVEEAKPDGAEEKTTLRRISDGQMVTVPKANLEKALSTKKYELPTKEQ